MLKPIIIVGCFTSVKETILLPSRILAESWNLTHHIPMPRNFLVRSYLGRGLVYFDRGNDGDALKDFNEAVELNPNYADAYFNRGRTYLRLGDDDHAISDFTLIIHPNSRKASTYFWRGLAYFAKGDNDLAIEDFTNAIKLDSEDVAAYFCRSMAYLRTEDSRYHAFNDLSTAGISSDPP